MKDSSTISEDERAPSGGELESARRAAIRGFVLDGAGIGDDALADDDDIFALGLVSSMFVMQLVHFVEQQCGVTVDADDLDFENFRSIAAVDALVARKLAA
ncbi:MAG: phosphopantetheine-binding protein [Acidobacteriota bacterium]